MKQKYVVKINNYTYRIICDCLDSDCDLDIIFEDIEGISEGSLIFMVNLRPSSIYGSFWKRIKYALDILFDRNINYSYDIILNADNAKSLRYVINKYLKSMVK